MRHPRHAQMRTLSYSAKLPFCFSGTYDCINTIQYNFGPVNFHFKKCILNQFERRKKKTQMLLAAWH